MKTWNYLKYDLSQNLVKMFVVAVCLSILVCVYLYDVQGFFVEMKENGVGNGMGSFFDYLAHFFCGEYEYELTASSEFFLPVDWLAYNGLIAYLVGFYSYEDMTRYGKISILYGGSKKSFFAAKILFQLLMVFWCYFVIYMNMALYVVAHSFRLEFSPTKAIWENTMTRLFEYDSLHLFCAMILLPIATSIVLSMMQLFFEFLISPVVGFMITMSVLVISVFHKSYMLIGSFTMWYRNEIAITEGLKTSVSFGVLAFLYVAFFLLCRRHFLNMDIIDKRRI